MSAYEFVACLNCGENNRVLSDKRDASICGVCKERLIQGTLYDVLEINSSANAYEIKQAYRKLAMKWHPDKNPDKTEIATARFKRITYAYEILSDESSRRQYNASLQQNARSSPKFTQPEMDDSHAANVFVEEMFGIAIEYAFQNNHWRDIAPILTQKGCPEGIAESIARSCVDYRKRIIRKAALRPFIIGLIALSIGGIITAATYNAASGGGTYVVAYGPMLYGGYQMLVALYRMIAGKVPNPSNVSS